MAEKAGIAYDLNTAPDYISLRSEDVMATFKIGKTSLWRWVKLKKLPPPYDYGGRAAHWTIGQIREWQSARAMALTQKVKDEMVRECKLKRVARRQVSGDFDLF
jgi:predicted DNA-binding transcriptional regulator AlpA